MLAHTSILLVDDVRTMRLMLRSTLRSFGVDNIAEAGDGREALQILSTRRFDLIITDLVMAPMDGVALTRHLRTPGTALPHTPIVILSGNKDAAHVKAALLAGASDFLVKPLVPSEMKSRLEKVLHTPRPVVRTPGYHGPDRRRRAMWVRNGRRRQDKDAEVSA